LSSRRVLPALTLLLLLVLPGSKYLWFDGLPLSNWPERVALLLLIFNAVPRSTRTRFRELLSHRSMHGWGGTLLLIVLVAKLWSYFAFPLGGGFEVCLRSLYSPVASCEKSYEGLFLTRDGVNALGSITRTDDLINFGPIDRSRPDTDQDTAGSTWNLPFSNDFPRFSELWLDRLPFRADIGTRIQSGQDAYLPIRLVGDLEIEYSRGPRGDQGTDRTFFSSYGTPTDQFVPIPKGQGVLRLRYEFKEGDVGSIPDSEVSATGPYATLQLFNLTDSTNRESDELLRPTPRDDPNDLQQLALSILSVSLAIIMFGFLLAIRTSRGNLYNLILVAVAGGLAALIDRGFGITSAFSISLLTSLCVLLYLAALRSHHLSRWDAAISIALGSTIVVIRSTAQRIIGLTETLPWDHLMFRGRDSDWLVYQGYARQIFIDHSLRGGESTFYFTPGMRYLAFLQHLILGDSDLLIALSVLVLLLASTLLLLQPVKDVQSGVVPLVVAVALTGTWLRPLILELIVNGAAEPLAWICVLIGILPLLSRFQQGVGRQYISCGAISFAVFLRPNLLFAALLLLLLWVISDSSKHDLSSSIKVRGILLSLTILALAFFHNLHYGESSTLFTAFVSLDRELSIGELMSVPLDPSIRAIVLDKVRIALHWGRSESALAVSVTSWLMQIVWLSTLIVVLRRGLRPRYVIALVAPLGYLISMLPFRYTTIAQRHFLSLTLLFGLAALYCLAHSRSSLGERNNFSNGPIY